MTLFQLGSFVLASGNLSQFKIECDALTDGDWQALAFMVSQLVGPFSSVEGVPRGGLKLAEMLQPYTTLGVKNNGHLIVDDVLTTGGSMEGIRQRLTGDLAKFSGRTEDDIRQHVPVRGAVVFARGPCPPWIKAVFPMPEVFHRVGAARVKSPRPPSSHA